MNSLKKKIIAVILIVFTLTLIIPYHAFTEVYASSVITSSSKIKASDYTTSAALAKKLTQVFEGKIGLYSSTKFTNQVLAPLGCSKLTGRNQYFIKGKATGSTNSGWQCYIYANAVYNTLYNEWVGRGTSLKNSKVVIKGGSTFSYKQFVKAGVKVGAYVRTTGNKNGSYSSSVAHSFVILGYNEENVTYIEGNANGKGLVRVTKSTWGELNKAQTTGRGRVICHVVQPTDKYFNSLYGANASSSGSSSANSTAENTSAGTTTKAVDPYTIKVSFKRTLSYSKSKTAQSGGDVLYMQNCLNYLGYSVTINSKFDSKSAQAVKKFQKAKRMTADGKIGSQTWKAIEKAVKAKKNAAKTTAADPDKIKVKFKRTLSYAKGKTVQSGNDVLYMQTCLKFIGYSVTANSKYDSNTANIVKKFQKAKKVTVDGKIGSNTWSLIEKAVKTEKSKVTVTFNANGGKNAPANQKMLPNTSTALSSTKPTRGGYTFLGWAKSKTATKADYKAGQKIKIKAKLTLYAVWQEQALKITSQPSDVSGSEGSKVTFSVKATGAGLSYQWYYMKSDNSDWVLWEGCKTASISVEADSTWAGMQVYCVVSGSNGKSVNSETATFTLA